MSTYNSTNTGKDITLTIDGKKCKGKFGQTILEIARENDIYIPTMCYLTKVLPIASCRMCVVEVEGVDGMILSCQEKALDGAVITTNNDSLFKERQNIMKLYDVNHPLQCGVCDKSGECDLQNKTLEFKVDSQNFMAKDQRREIQNWGYVSYDPALCIMCEKCVRVSNEITGNELLEVKMGGYGSTIINNNPEINDPSLAESAAVCPVGALVSRHFKYSANAWELQKIPSACSHCSVGCAIDYEVKKNKIYRVGNDAEFATLCGAGRYGFDFANRCESKDKEAFDNALKAFKEAKTILFSSTKTNEEALILQKIKEKTGAKLVSPQAKAYQEFMQSYSQITGKSLYNGKLEDVKNSSVVIVFGSAIAKDAPVVKYHINMASKHNRARVAYMHPIEDSTISNIVTQFIKYEAGSEEGVIALLASYLIDNIPLTKTISKFINDLDIGYLRAESNVGEEELELLKKSMDKKQGYSLIVGSDLYTHPRAKEIAKLIALLELYGDFKVICVPPTTNALGVSLICDLDSEIESPTVGYNMDGDFVLSSVGDGNLDIPALNQQEGTITTLDKRVVPLNVAQPYNGYVLNDIANALGIVAQYTIDYTKSLPTNRGFEAVDFDDLANRLDCYGNDTRGYALISKKVSVARNFDDVAELETYDGAVIYHCDTPSHFNKYSVKSPLLPFDAILIGSKAFATAAKLNDGDSIEFKVGSVVCKREFKVDENLKGTIAINPIADIGVGLFELSDYRFERLSNIRNS